MLMYLEFVASVVISVNAKTKCYQYVLNQMKCHCSVDYMCLPVMEAHFDQYCICIMTGTPRCL